MKIQVVTFDKDENGEVRTIVLRQGEISRRKAQEKKLVWSEDNIIRVSDLSYKTDVYDAWKDVVWEN